MKAIIRNCSHGSDIVVSMILDKQLKCDHIEKTTATAMGLQILENEYRGYAWYNQFLNKNITVSLEENECRHCLRLGFVDGHCANYRTGLLKNTEVIKNVVMHYCDVWHRCDRSDGYVCAHGDLSLSNVLVTRSNPIIIDWEHYSINILPVGFDALYLLFVSLYFEIGKAGYPDKRMLDFISEQIAFIKKKGCLNTVYESDPLAAIMQNIRKNRVRWNLSEGDIIWKLPILQWQPEIVNYIDKELKNRNC